MAGIGGYITINFNGATIGEDAITVKDAYKKATAGKAILLENFTLDEISTPFSVFTFAIPSESECIMTIPVSGNYNFIVRIDDDDNITGETVQIATAE